MLKARVAALDPAERAAFRAKVEAAGIDWEVVAPAQTPHGRLPLSPSQTQFWLNQMLAPDSAAFAIAFAWQIDGPLDADALDRALARLCQRHAPLRTVFPSEDGLPWQEITSHLPRLERTVPDDPDDDAGRFTAQPFDLAVGPVFRVRLQRLGAMRHRLLFSLHHIIADGWSRGIVMRELQALYRAECSGTGAGLPELKRDYAALVADHTAWQQSAGAARQTAFWRQELAGMSRQSLPGNRAAAEMRAETCFGRIPVDLAEKVGPMAAQFGVTPFVLLLAVFHLLLHRLSGQADIATGSPVAGRDRAETQDLIGLFVNTLVLRNQVRPGEAFHGWLSRVHAGFVRALEHADLPFAHVAEASNAPRIPGETPLFQTLFQVQGAGYGRQNAEIFDLAPGLCATQQILPLRDAKFDLSWHMMVQPDGIAIIAEYRAGLFDPGFINRMIAQFNILLDAAITSPGCAVEDLPFTTAPMELTGPEAPIPDLLGLIARNAGRSVLLDLASGQRHSGEDLLARADDLARRLCACAELETAPVGICLPRGVDLVVAILAALQAGVPYVPLDPGHPAVRRQMILSDAGVGLVLSDDPACADVPVLHPRADGPQGTLPAPDPDPDPARVAYVIFTSGTTGRPKGVPVSYRALSNLIGATARVPGLGPDDRLLAVTTVAFDIAALELLLPLATGATLVLADAAHMQAPDQLARSLHDHRITHMQATPATWRLLLEHAPDLRGLTALCGGEALPSDLARDMLKRGVALWNMYGPTEATIWSAALPLTLDALTGGTALIGGPLANTRMLALDGYGQPLPPGVPGELAIGGAGLSPGYWRNPDLTARRFVDGLYRTGDEVTICETGEVQFLGRLDDQIKLNGYRIEPAEIEAALLADPAVEAAAVVLRGGRLVACLVGAAQPASALRQQLAQVLPSYMIPAVFHPMAALPLTPNGKIDRAALPDPQSSPTTGRSPESEAEHILATIWAEVLGQETVPVDANFFEIGGASVEAIQIASRARARGITLTPAQLFTYQTVAEQAAVAVCADAPALTPWQAALQARRGDRAYLTCTQILDGPQPVALSDAIRAVVQAHPVLQTGSHLWRVRLDGDVLQLEADPILLDPPSLERLGQSLRRALQDEHLPADHSFADWMQGKAGDTAEVLPLEATVASGASDAGASDPVHSILTAAQQAAFQDRIKTTGQRPADLAATELAALLRHWRGAGQNFAVIDYARATGLGQFTRVRMPGCDGPGFDPRILPEGCILLDWTGRADLVKAAIHIAFEAPGSLTWHFDPERVTRAVIRRLAGRLAMQLGQASASVAPAREGLDRLRARLAQNGGRG